MNSHLSVSFCPQVLKAALIGLGKIIGRKVTLPVLGCIRISCDPVRELATLASTDLDSHLELDLPARSVAREGAILVSFQELREALKHGSGDELVTLREERGDSVMLTRERAGTCISVPLTSLPEAEFPENHSFSRRAFTLDPADRDAFLQAMECVSSDSTRHVIQGVKIEGGHTFVATDGRHLFRSNSMKLPLKADVILPSLRVLEWKTLREDESWGLVVDSEYFRLSGANWRLTGKLIDGTYPNWRQILPADDHYAHALRLPPEELPRIVEMLRTLPGEKSPNKPVGLSCSANAIELIARNRYEDPYTVVPIQGTYTGARITTFVNRDYLARALSFGLNRIDFADATSPVRLREDDASRRDVIIMPVRVATPESIPASPELPPPANVPETPMKTTPPVEETETTDKGTQDASRDDLAHTARKNAPEASAVELALINLQQAREYLRMALAELGELGNALKQARIEQRNTDREIRQVRSTIRSLQKVEL